MMRRRQRPAGSSGGWGYLGWTIVVGALVAFAARRYGVSAWVAGSAVLLFAFVGHALLRPPSRYRIFGPGQTREAIDHQFGHFGRDYPEDRTHLSQPRVGRNDKCPCGSGRKYKHCCGA